jgi:hypothetical protein
MTSKFILLEDMKNLKALLPSEFVHYQHIFCLFLICSEGSLRRRIFALDCSAIEEEEETKEEEEKGGGGGRRRRGEGRRIRRKRRGGGRRRR